MTEIKDKKPLNPFFMIGFYSLFLFILPFFIINASDQTIHSLHVTGQAWGTERMLLSLNRFVRMKAFLLERLNQARWERIHLYYTVFFATLIPLMLYLPYQLRHFVGYLKNNNPAWQIIQEDKQIKDYRKVWVILGLLSMTPVWMLLRSVHDLAHPPRKSNLIHLSDFGYFQQIFETTLMLSFFHYFCWGTTAISTINI